MHLGYGRRQGRADGGGSDGAYNEEGVCCLARKGVVIDRIPLGELGPTPVHCLPRESMVACLFGVVSDLTAGMADALQVEGELEQPFSRPSSARISENEKLLCASQSGRRVLTSR